jgi:hypothetical protein
MLFSVDSNIRFPTETLLLAVVESASELGLCFTRHISNVVRSKKMIKEEHVGIPSIPGPQGRLDVSKTGMFSTYVGHDVPNLAPVAHKGASSVRRSCSHLLINSLSSRGVFFLRSHRNFSSDNIVQCRTSDSIL